MHTTNKPLVVALRALAVSMLIALGLAACGSGSDTTTADDTSAETEASSGAEDTAAEDMAEEDAADETAEETPADDMAEEDSGASTDEADASAADETADTGDQSSSLTTSSSETELVDAGAEPRQLLELTAGEMIAYDISAVTTQTITSDLGTEQVVIGPIASTIESSAQGTWDEALQAWTVTEEITGATVEAEDPSVASGAQAEAQAQIGITFTSEVKKDTSRTLTGQVAGVDTTIENAPFPGEPVGVGAVWRSSAALNFDGLVATQTNTYTLTALEGSVVTIKVETTIDAEPNQVVAGATMESFQGTGSGTITTDLATGAANTDLSNTITQAISAGGQSITQTIETVQTTTTTPK